MVRVSREFLKDNIRRSFDFSTTKQNRGVAPPPVEKPFAPAASRIDLVSPREWKDIEPVSVEAAIAQRRSRRKFTEQSITKSQLSFLLWATQGILGRPTATHAFRTVPSAGCRHALETYVAAFRVEGLERGLYRYLPLTHQLLPISGPEDLEYQVGMAADEQFFVGEGAATFIWTAIPHRMEWRYGPPSFKLIALDAGHVCQNLYLACEAIGAGTCGIAAYDQARADALVGADGKDEFVIYLAPVGKIQGQGQTPAGPGEK
jgi:SagB-type dehydrogenase family enzyme